MKKELSREIVKNKLDKVDFTQPLSFVNIRDRTRINGKLINRRYMLGYLYKSGEFQKVKPLDIGSHKHKNNLNVWTKV
tara:strand:- start:285 stop:518 length:234 start_codon:yes stop_codon:yes gene_type:complete